MLIEPGSGLEQLNAQLRARYGVDLEQFEEARLLGILSPDNASRSLKRWHRKTGTLTRKKKDRRPAHRRSPPQPDPRARASAAAAATTPTSSGGRVWERARPPARRGNR